jgi:primosomal protein N' (replication factor Y)
VADRRNDGALDVLPGTDMPPLDALPPAAAPGPAGGKPAHKEAAKGSKGKKPKEPRTLRPAADYPVARIAVDLPLAHLDRPFDYLVPERLAEQARPGVRVRVRFAGQLVDGFLLERVRASEHQGRLSYLDRVVSAERVLTAEIAGLARAVADHYAGTFADVLRLAIPPRHAATEAAGPEPAAAVRGGTGLPPRPDPGSWTRYPAGPAFLDAIADGRPARAAWTALPGPAWPQEIARAAVTAASRGRGAVIVVPDSRDLARVDAALTELLTTGLSTTELLTPGLSTTGLSTTGLSTTGPAGHVILTADLGPAERYRRWLAASRGEVSIVAGTRAAMFAPVARLGLVILWDDGDDLHADPHAPYPNARDVLALRAHRAGAAALIGGFARTAELAQLVAAGWAHHLGPDRQTLRAVAPRVRPAVDDKELARDEAAATARLPSLALRTARAALATGPVLIQVPRRGYLAAIACARCRAQARCVQPIGQAATLCNGPLRQSAPSAAPDCRWCGALAGGWRCQDCGHDKVRAIVIGATRTAEELGRAFPGVKVRNSGGDKVLPVVPDQPALVIATPGAEPVANYAAALLLDGWALLSRPSLRAAEETLRRWLAAAALVRPDGTVLVHADPALRVTQAAIRWDPVTFAERELAERAELGFPPAVRMAAVTGNADAVASVLSEGARGAFEILGPVPAERDHRELGRDPADAGEQVRALVRAPRRRGGELAKAMHSAQAGRSSRKEGGGVRVQLDPAELI